MPQAVQQPIGLARVAYAVTRGIWVGLKSDKLLVFPRAIFGQSQPVAGNVAFVQVV